jgi:hypothetical protein
MHLVLHCEEGEGSTCQHRGGINPVGEVKALIAKPAQKEESSDSAGSGEAAHDTGRKAHLR